MEMHLSFFTLTALFLLLSFLFLLIKEIKGQKNTRDAKKLPPGPKQLPFIGNLHQMVGSLPHHKLRKLADKYGPIMHLQLGELSTIVISSTELAKEVLQTHSAAFANRPQLMVAKIMLYNSLGVTFSPYGDYWRKMRHMYITELLNTKSVHSLFGILEDEVSKLTMSIESLAGKPIILGEMILSYLNTAISRATVGRICIDQDALIMATREAASLAGIFNLADLFPSVKILQLVNRSKAKLEETYRKLDGILEDIISGHEKNKIGTKADNQNPAEEDIVDILLRLKKSNDFQLPITSSNIKAIIFELAVAGTITSLVAIEWAISELMKNPKVMEKAQAEVRQAFKGQKKISGVDIQKLKYLKWVIKETLRLHPPGPLLAPRECREQCEISGYTIPINTVTIINAGAIGRDPKYWNNPENFEPERFSNSSIDFTGNSFELLPFGAGKRLCPGINYAVANIELLLANLLYHFDWKLPGGITPEEFDMTEKFAAAVTRKDDLCLLAKSYVPSDV